MGNVSTEVLGVGQHTGDVAEMAGVRPWVSIADTMPCNIEPYCSQVGGGWALVLINVPAT